ncbi:hypothetical protein QBZ16_002144 [Prototheca wickerhamii]|uniref:Anaphase-promoting complex subunit 4 WD40 domain-containing protein n=1 Tax=Prototheca wickerhamii TaxID=3111 RepID=A0AAD9IM79_PROWI|nr:hypothetical protein QBZ16_002144 [Prototheca wickerhamii]
MVTDETPILACSAAHRAVALALQPTESGGAPSEVAVWLAAAQPSVLAHPLQVAVGALAWRAAGLQELAVGCLGGVALWRLPAVVDPTRSGTAIVPGAGTLTWLPAPKALLAQTARVDALAWHPHGHLLAAASSSVAGGFCVYDVARPEATAIKVSSDPVTTLAWSPCGAYLLTGHGSGALSLWETGTWTHAQWSFQGGRRSELGASPGGPQRVVAACWAPPSAPAPWRRAWPWRTRARPAQLTALHLVHEAPSLEAQMVPVSLGSGGLDRPGLAIASMTWSACGRFIALGHADGAVRLFAASCRPLLSAVLVETYRDETQGRVPWALAGAATAPSKELMLARASNDVLQLPVL